MTSPLYVARKNWHSSAGAVARLRALWLIVVRRHETEICARCGGAVGLVWWDDDDARWHEVTGFEHGGGTLCVPCYDLLARHADVTLRWSVGLL